MTIIGHTSPIKHVHGQLGLFICVTRIFSNGCRLSRQRKPQVYPGIKIVVLFLNPLIQKNPQIESKSIPFIEKTKPDLVKLSNVFNILFYIKLSVNSNQ